MLGRFNKAPAAEGQPWWPECRTGASMAAMKRVFFAAALLFALPGMAVAEKDQLKAQVYDLYAQKCVLELTASLAVLDIANAGVLRWNGTPIDSSTFESYLKQNTAPSPKEQPIYFHVVKKGMKQDVVELLTRYGFTLHRCKELDFTDHIGH